MDFPCDYRGAQLASQTCQTCGQDKGREIEVYHCNELGRPCSVHAHNLRVGNSRTGPKMTVCIRCDIRTVDGVRAAPLGAIAIQRVQRAEQQPRPPHALQVLLGTRVRQERERLGLSLTDAATAAGCNVGTWQSVEDGKHWPSAERLAGIAAALQVSPAELLA